MDAASESSPILMEHTCTFYIHVKDYFQSVHYKRRTQLKANRYYSLRTTHLIFEAFQIPFPTASLIFTAVKLFHEVI